VNRRRVIFLSVAATALVLAAMWDVQEVQVQDEPEGAPILPVPVQNSAGRTGAFYVPPSAPAEDVAVLVLIHGTGSSGMRFIPYWRALADSMGFVIVAPDSRVSPSGQRTWQVGDRPSEVTEDLTHTLAVFEWVRREVPLDVDESKVLIAGFSGGGSTAPYVATNRPPFSHAATLHGRIFPGGLGSRRIPLWFSTGDEDELATVAETRRAVQSVSDRFEVTSRIFSAGHGLGAQEKGEVIRWWLGGVDG
jgi:predicted esterase